MWREKGTRKREVGGVKRPKKGEGKKKRAGTGLKQGKGQVWKSKGNL